jgi:antitoxin component YwqK of YwqJK toxin-antitoxin module
MRSKIILLLLVASVFVSCRHRNTVVESAYPDGTPKRVCTYLGKGTNKILLNETGYYKNRKVQFSGEYKHSQRDGKWVYYYESGKVWSEGYFRNGKNEGKRTTYYPNGKVRYEAHYRDDKKVGIWKFYDETGRIVKAVNFSAAPKPPAAK